MATSTYYILSGEGEIGTWECVTTSNIKSRLTRERCHGDRWAHAVAHDEIQQYDDGCYGPDELGQQRLVPIFDAS